jgi:hypothetical protein
LIGDEWMSRRKFGLQRVPRGSEAAGLRRDVNEAAEYGPGAFEVRGALRAKGFTCSHVTAIECVCIR